jgi:hypothetical protein
MNRKWKFPVGIRPILLLGLAVLLSVAVYYWFGLVFYLLPAVAAILFVVVSAIAIAPEFQEKLAKQTRVLLVCLLTAAGIGGVVSDRLQDSEQENRADFHNKQLLTELGAIKQSVNRLVAEGKLTKADAAKILSRASHLRKGDQVWLDISFEGNDNFLNAELMCLVTDPENRSYWSGPLASGTAVSGLGISGSYPSSFKGAPHLRSGTYNVTWIMAADSQAGNRS